MKTTFVQNIQTHVHIYQPDSQAFLIHIEYNDTLNNKAILELESNVVENRFCYYLRWGGGHFFGPSNRSF